MKPFAKIPFDPARIRLPYAYVIVVIGALAILLSAPGQTIGVSVFTDGLSASLGLSRLKLSVGYLVGTAFSALLITRIGPLLDRYGARLVGTVGCLALGLSCVYMATLVYLQALLGSSAWSAMTLVTLGFFLLRFTGQGVLTLMSRTMVMRWFVEYRGRVNGFIGLSIGLMLSLTPKVFDIFIENWGWQGAYQRMGLMLALVFAPLLLLLLRDNPEECGLRPDGLTLRPKEAAESLPEYSWSADEVKRDYTFWVFNLSVAFMALVFTGWTFHITSIFAEAGRPREAAIAVFPASAFIGLGLNILWGFLADSRLLRDRLHLFLLLMLLSVGGLCGATVLLEFNASWPTVVVLNATGGSLFGLISSITWARYYGRKNLGAITGLNMATIVLASAIGPLLFAASKHWTESYDATLWGLAAVAAVLFLTGLRAVKPEPKPPTQASLRS